MNHETRKAFPLSVLAAVLLAAFGSTRAADEITELSKPESTVNLGGGYVSEDNHFFGQYTGMVDEGAYGVLDFNIVNRDEENGTWARLDGRNLGREDRELRFEHRRQGDWGYFLEYSQIPRYEPYTVNTAVTGIGTSSLTVPAVSTPGVPVELKSERDRFGLGLDKQLSDTLDVQIRVRNEQKSGERLFARGTFGGFEFAPEPLDASTTLVEALLGYTGKQLQLSGGYYGSIYNNHNNRLDVAGGVAALSTFTPIGLPPDNQSHQLNLSGGYSITNTTRSTFKLAYASATQTDNFIVPAITGYPSLDGRVDTTQAQLGVTSHPWSNLSLLANVRHENREDKTPVRFYTTPPAGPPAPTFNGYYEPRSLKTTTSKVEAGYRLPMGFRAVGGIDYENNERHVPYWFSGSLATVSSRAETDELTYRAQLHRSLSETVNGYVVYSYSDRNGTDFLRTVLNDGATGSNLIAPLYLADRNRDKVRVSVDWTPIDRLTMQFIADSARDDYTARTAQDLGPRHGDAKSYTIDANLLLGDTWQATAWVSRTDNRTEQATCENASVAGGICPNTAADPYWQVSTRNIGNAVGLGLRGQPFSKLELGADVQYSAYRDEYRQLATTTGAITPVVPDITTLVTLVRLTAKYEIQKNAGVRLDYNYERWNSDDWQWSSWTYTDGTQLVREPVEKVQYVGLSGYVRWW